MTLPIISLLDVIDRIDIPTNAVFSDTQALKIDEANASTDLVSTYLPTLITSQTYLTRYHVDNELEGNGRGKCYAS